MKKYKGTKERKGWHKKYLRNCSRKLKVKKTIKS